MVSSTRSLLDVRRVPWLLVLGWLFASGAQATPTGVSSQDWTGIRAAYDAERHAIEVDADGVRSARNPGQRWRTRFDGHGYTVSPDAGGWTWGLELQSFGFAGAQTKVSTASVSHQQGELHYDWSPNLREWFINDTRGLQQGWVVNERPQAGTDGGRLHLELGVRGGLRPQLSSDATAVSFVDTKGGIALNFGGLKAWDADGQPLAARFEHAGNSALRIAVDERAARYPITIDPIAQQAYVKASNTGESDLFGVAVAMSGDTMVVGARGESSNATGINGDQNNNSAPESGAAYVFVRNGPTWTQQAYLKASNTESNDQFGISVAVSGDTVVVGAYREASNATGINGNQANNSAADAGAAYVFTRSGTTWSQQAYLKASNTGASDFFGYTVAVSGDTAVVSAEGEDGNGNTLNASGAAYVFVRNGTTWTQQALLRASNPAVSDGFGHAAISGDIVVVGAPNEDNGGSNAGAAYIYARSGTAWTEQAYLKASNPGAGDLFGIAVAVSGETAVVAAYLEDSNATGVNGNQNNDSALESGAAYVFSRNGTIWTQQAYLKASNTGSNDIFGTSVALSGDTIAVGAAHEDSAATGIDGDQDDNSFPAAGAAYLYSRNGTTWTQKTYLKASNTGAGDQFGSAVALAGSSALVGAWFERSNATGVDGDEGDNSASQSGAAYVYDEPPSGSFAINNANRFGNPAAGIAGVAVTLFVGAQIFDTAITDASGNFEFDSGVDLQQLYDLKLEGSGASRVYQAIRPSELANTALVLPIDLRTRLTAKLNLLDATSPAVLAYDTAAARTLMSDWNVLQPELAAVHGNRDRALGRLLTASEGLAGAYTDTHPLAMESAKLTVDLVTSALALRKLLADLSAAATTRVATLVAQGTSTQLSASIALQFVLKGIEIGVTLLQDTIIGGIQSVLPQWGEEQLAHGIDVTTKSVLGAFESGAWTNVAGRGALLGALTEVIAAEVGGRVIASAYVAQTQSDLGLSAIRARALFGSGTVGQGFVASQEHASFVALRNADVISLSQAVGSTAKGWTFAADLFLLVGETAVPGAQLIAAAGSIVKSMSVGGLVVAGVNDYSTAFITAFDDAPVVAGRAFTPSLPPPVPGAYTVLRARTVLNVIPSDYPMRLAALKDRVNVNDHPGAITAAQALFDTEDALEVAVEAELLRLQALAAANDSESLATAQRATLATAGVLGAERMSVYGLLAGYVVPELAPAGAVDPELLAKIDLVSAAIVAFENAVIDAENAANGLTSPGFIVVPEHGLTTGGTFAETPPGTIVMRARVTNAGLQAAQGVVVGLAFGVDPIPVQVAVLDSPTLQNLGTLAPGESRIVTWNALATDVSAGGTGSAATYEISLTASTGSTTNAVGGFEVLTALNLVFRNGFEQ